MPQDLINAKPAAAAVGILRVLQLSQFMDQNNPLTEITHKRRLSTLGPGGLTRNAPVSKCATCTRPITADLPDETPEGRTSASSIPTRPMRGSTNTASSKPVSQGQERPRHQRNHVSHCDRRRPLHDRARQLRPTDADTSPRSRVVRQADDAQRITPQGELHRLSPNQPFSFVATIFVPFVENDDANRALMGSNMQSQAVPLVVPRSAGRCNGHRKRCRARFRRGDRRPPHRRGRSG